AHDFPSRAFDRFATSPCSVATVARPRGRRPTRPRPPQGPHPQGLPDAPGGWSWRRELNPRPADYKSAALPLSYASDKPRLYESRRGLASQVPVGGLALRRGAPSGGLNGASGGGGAAWTRLLPGPPEGRAAHPAP